MSEYERYFIMSLDTDEEFVFDRVDVDANKIFGDIKISFEDAVDLLNKQDTEIKKLKQENQKLTELINLIAEAHSYTKEESVKDILRHKIWAIDTVAGESADAWHDYCILNKFFKEHYGEHWDNFEDK